MIEKEKQPFVECLLLRARHVTILPLGLPGSHFTEEKSEAPRGEVLAGDWWSPCSDVGVSDSQALALSSPLYHLQAQFHLLDVNIDPIGAQPHRFLGLLRCYELSLLSSLEWSCCFHSGSR